MKLENIYEVELMFEDGIIFFINVIMFDEMEIFELFVRVSSI